MSPAYVRRDPGARQYVLTLQARLGLRSHSSIRGALDESPRFAGWREAHRQSLDAGECDRSTHRRLSGCPRMLATLAAEQRDGRTLYEQIMSKS